MSMCFYRESDNTFESILCNRRTVEHYGNDPISNSLIDHHAVFSLLHLYKLTKDYEQDVSANRLEVFICKHKNEKQTCHRVLTWLLANQTSLIYS